MVPECGVDAEPPPSWVTRFGLSWAGHQIHVLPINKLLDSGSPRRHSHPKSSFEQLDDRVVSSFARFNAFLDVELGCILTSSPSKAA